MDKEKLKGYFEDVVVCALEDSKATKNDPDGRENFVKEVVEKLCNHADFYAVEEINENFLNYANTKRKREKERSYEKIKHDLQDSVTINLDEISSYTRLRRVKRRKMNDVIEKIHERWQDCHLSHPAEKKIPDDLKNLPRNDENQVELWDYIPTYDVDQSCILSLVNAPIIEVFEFLIRNCHSIDEMIETMDQASQYSLFDEETAVGFIDLLKTIEEKTEEKIKDLVNKHLEEKLKNLGNKHLEEKMKDEDFLQIMYSEK